MTLNQHIQVLKSWINQGHTPPPGSPGGLQWIGVDPAGRQRNDQTGASNTTVLAAAGFPIKSRKSGVDEGLRLIRARLRPAPACEHEPLKPRLLVHERCTRLIECLERYHYPADKPESLEPAKDGFDHACDALRYMILNLDNPSTTSVRTY